ncbi:unnamed protein product [Kuraishia capsulata CBS 1993]|uniref:ATP synthase subunit 5, mitochondrial n=1 Tax=Kuraishia capsulata CBS 1993 TaxID=1382522 RepID=W6MGN5_9ASCO|nr:uncharacterized protein KUCA_T00000689001 [Kuraishia capsulata CBS 1993]CDK24723.1 unnamed protein product [Kuraishia capsulata CBS 1993]
MASRMFFRSLATAAQSVKPPVQLFGLDGTYATALYTAAAKDSSIEKAAASLKSLQSALEKDPKTSGILTNPALSLDDRKVLVSTLASSYKLEPVVVNLLNVLAENNRLPLFEDVFNQFSVLNDAHNGLVEATVTSATKLDPKLLNRISKAISASKYVGQGKTLKLTNNVESDILGGLIVEVADRTVDLSISSKITKLNKTLTETI